MTKPAGAALLLAAAALFLFANRASYRSYFQDDELNNISWTGELAAGAYARSVVLPRFFTNNFRPVGHFYYHVMTLQYGLDFPKWLPVIHLAHVLNFWMVWLLARRLGAAALPATLGTLFFAFHAASFDIYWKPMYVFDLFCATFTLACLLLWTSRRFVLAFAAYWLAYKSKELAVMIPVVLAAHELWIAKDKRWKPLIPFFAASASFGIQGVLMNPNADNDYTFRFTPGAFWTCLQYYSSQLLLMPYAGLALLPLPFVVRDRRLWLGLAMLCVFFVPLLFLPGRLFAAYCYLPLTGLAMAIAALASKYTRAVAVLAIAWIPWNLYHLRTVQADALRIADENRAYVLAVNKFARASKDTKVFVYDGAPSAMHVWGIEGALDIAYGRPPELLPLGDPASGAALKRPDAALLRWDAAARRLAITQGSAAIFGSGWYEQESGFRWIAPQASATIPRPEGARELELTVNLSPDQLKQTGPVTIAVAMDGAALAAHTLREPGVQTLRWPVPTPQPQRPEPPAQPGAKAQIPVTPARPRGAATLGLSEPAAPSGSGSATIDIRVTPEYRPINGDARVLGAAVLGLGFR